MKLKKLVVFSGPSGSGKTTIINYLLKQNLSLGFSISATSRKPRGKEKDGIAYYFLTENEFKKKIDEKAFIEYEEVYTGIFYGTLKSELDRIWDDKKHIIFDIDVQGGLKIKTEFPEKTLAVFIQPPSLKELEKRLFKRGTENETKIQQRLDKSAQELSFSKDFDIVIINEDLNQTKNKVKYLVKEFLNN